MKIGIVGLGYVGLPLSLQFARSGVTVLGFDIDTSKVDSLNQGRSFIKHITSEAVGEAVKTGTFSATTDFSRVREVKAVVICVPTPLNKNREPDISYIINTGKAMARYLQQGTLVVLESTTYPGTTDEDLREVLEIGSGMEAGKDFHLAFSPEREDPGNPDSKVAIIPKVVGGYTPRCLELATQLYSKAIKTIVPVSSCRAIWLDWMSTKKNAGASLGMRFVNCSRRFPSISAVATSTVRPSPSDSMTIGVGAPGRCRLASASRRPARRGLPARAATSIKSRANSGKAIKAPTAPSTNQPAMRRLSARKRGRAKKLALAERALGDLAGWLEQTA